MQDYDKQDYGECNTCGAPRVKNPKTGKIFCSDKCWLKNGSTTASQPVKYQNNEAVEILKEIRDILKGAKIVYPDGK